MPQSLTNIYLHIVFSTKERKTFLRDRDTRQQLHAYLVGVCKRQDCVSLQVGGYYDHCHLLVNLGKKFDISTLIRELKMESSKWMKSERGVSDFYWQKGYGAFSISPSHIDPVRQYIKNQENHHQKISYKEEFRRLCMKNKIDIDEKFVWD